LQSIQRIQCTSSLVFVWRDKSTTDQIHHRQDPLFSDKKHQHHLLYENNPSSRSRPRPRPTQRNIWWFHNTRVKRKHKEGQGGKESATTSTFVDKQNTPAH
jgi:hypothetical protein